jgi:hypothetical protein
MSAPAAIQAQLVDVRNVSSHKCVRLEIHVPAEQAGLVMAAFGWPTMADPVPVALARLDLKATANPEATKERRTFTELPYAQQAAMRCQEPDFQRFMMATGRRLTITLGKPDAEEVADSVRELCGVLSRKELDTHPSAGERWREIEAEYWAWQRGRR